MFHFQCVAGEFVLACPPTTPLVGCDRWLVGEQGAPLVRQTACPPTIRWSDHNKMTGRWIRVGVTFPFILLYLYSKYVFSSVLEKWELCVYINLTSFFFFFSFLMKIMLFWRISQMYIFTYFRFRLINAGRNPDEGFWRIYELSSADIKCEACGA